MDGFDPTTSYGPDVAQRYDDHHVRGDEQAAVTFLAKYATGGTALEFAIGTGRVALPLAAQGVKVDGIELSPDMVARLQAKAGGQDLDILVGDMASATTGKTYPLVYLVFNTIFNILTQDGQVECFRNAARHLADDGVFVVEAAPPWAWIRGSQFVNVERIAAGISDVRRQPIRPRNSSPRREPREPGPDRRHHWPNLLSSDLAIRDGPHGPARRPTPRC